LRSELFKLNSHKNITMKRSILVFSSMLMLTFIVTAYTPILNSELEIGAPIPEADLKMMDVGGIPVSLSEAKKENGLLVIFSCNTCPYVKLSETRIKEMALYAKANKIGVVIVNSNEAQRDAQDSFTEMKKYAHEQTYTFNYVLDKNSQLANAFGASRTPQCFLFDAKALVYRGSIDDNVKEANDAKEHYLIDAMNALVKNTPVKVNSTKSIGCTIKRVEDY
jgi:peroxiredoxin